MGVIDDVATRINDAVGQIKVTNIYVTYSLIILSAVAVIYAASVATIQKPDNAAYPDRSSELFHPSDLERIATKERLSQGDAMIMPIAGGAVLVSLYFAFRYFDEELIQYWLKVYFVAAGSFAVISTSSLAIKSFLRVLFNASVPYFKIVWARDEDYGSVEPGKEKDYVISAKDMRGFMSLDSAWFFTLPFGAAFMMLASNSPNWIFNNIIGASLAITGISTIRLGSLKVGLLMLALLFCYDIYFVFGTDVMVTVATKVEGPIKLEVPRPPVAGEPEAARHMALLGLGDIVAPGCFLSACLRFDVWQYYSKHPNTPFHLARKVPTPYFLAGFFAYVLGLAATIAAMHYFQAGQPALLYLCPSLAFTSLAMAYFRGEFDAYWAYSEEEEDEEEKEKKLEQKDEKNRGTLEKEELLDGEKEGKN
ncbi:hypothetical protein TRVA0_055S00166 [Trichomonascus vanleenenianus]|uniref:aspartic endopeptidase n=1 Tax=Trichomonascus vanleenenianus TaxID=2268995 RepID=UPI003ECB20EC